jgi:hypothetical protein
MAWHSVKARTAQNHYFDRGRSLCGRFALPASKLWPPLSRQGNCAVCDRAVEVNQRVVVADKMQPRMRARADRF